jgi:glycosyltransferase involved in cell wall biosynthesis
MGPLKPSVLFVHNKYLHKGGEDSVVHNEMEVLTRNAYTIHYLEFQNQQLSKAGFGAFSMPLKLFYNLNAFLKVYRLVRKHRIQVVHVHNFFYTASPSVFWAAKAAGASTVMTLHNYRLFCLNGVFFLNGKTCFDCHTNKSFSKGITGKCFKSSGMFSAALALSTRFHRLLGTWVKKVDRFIAVNPFMPHLLEEIGVPAGRIVVRPNFLPMAGNGNYHHYHQRDDYYLYAGRLSEEKGIQHLVAAFTKAKKKLLIFGEGELSDFVRQHTSEYIRYEGAQPPEVLFKYYAQCRALVFPSLWIEGMPMTLIEARSTGAIPIVATTINSRGFVNNETDGFLYEAGNPDDLIRVINLFEGLSEEALNKLSEDSYNRFQQHYSEMRYLQTLEQVYHF